MSHYPTDLNPAEEQRARQRLAELADRFEENGVLRTPEWREAFLVTWRHPYVPGYYPAMDRPPVLCIDPEQRADWLDAVYSDQTLVTKVQALVLSRALRPATGWMYTSSSTMPSLVLRMLETLDVRNGSRVLEIGTGSGYNCALLCERLGSDHVTSIDIDSELVDLARERLAANGHTPTLAATDGVKGYPDSAPYDRIISTCAVPSIPPTWLEQAAPGAIILTDVHGPLGGTLARLIVDADATAIGRFVSYGTGFMTMRHAVEPETSSWSRLELDEHRSWTSIDPDLVMQEGLFGFVLQWMLPHATRSRSVGDDGEPAVFLLDRDGSRAEVAISATARGYLVRQYGERRLWDEVEQIHQFWQANGQPGYERFGLTATSAGQQVWLDDPDGPHRWTIS